MASKITAHDKNNNPGLISTTMNLKKKKFTAEKLNLLKASHPIAGAFHIILKALPCFAYMFMGMFGFKDVSVFISVLIMISLDFWVTKNIIGRFMVGLRWWGTGDFGDDFDESEGNDWYFESYDWPYPNQTYDNHIFWWGLVGPEIFWLFYCVIGVISLSFFWGTLTVIALALTSTNLYAYYMARQDNQKKLKIFFEEQTDYLRDQQKKVTEMTESGFKATKSKFDEYGL